jgi:hypothetical protein
LIGPLDDPTQSDNTTSSNSKSNSGSDVSSFVDITNPTTNENDNNADFQPNSKLWSGSRALSPLSPWLRAAEDHRAQHNIEVFDRATLAAKVLHDSRPLANTLAYNAVTMIPSSVRNRILSRTFDAKI